MSLGIIIATAIGVVVGVWTFAEVFKYVEYVEWRRHRGGDANGTGRCL